MINFLVMNKNDSFNETEKKSFWDSTIGTIAKITGFITAITALVIAIKPLLPSSNKEVDVKPPIENSNGQTPSGNPEKPSGNNGGKMDAVKGSIKVPPQPYVATSDDITTFLNAAKTGDVATLKLKLDAGINPDINAPGDPTTALINAIDNNKPEAVSILLDHNANCDSKVRGNSYPIIEASFWGYAEIVELLIQHKANLNIRKQDGSQISPLMFASIRGFKDVVKKLIDAGADINIKANNNWTALDFANASSSADKSQILAMLIAVGAHSGIGP